VNNLAMSSLPGVYFNDCEKKRGEREVGGRRERGREGKRKYSKYNTLSLLCESALSLEEGDSGKWREKDREKEAL